MKRSCHYQVLALIVPLLAVVFSAGQLGLGQRAEAAAKSEPVAVLVGPDFQVSVGTTISVDGSLSYDPSGKKLHYNWELLEAPSDSSARITKKNSPKASFTPDKHGTYVIELTVHNGIKSSDSVSITFATTYTDYDLIPVDIRVQSTPQGDYGIQVGTNIYWPSAYYPGTGTASATGFQVLVLERSSLLPAQTLQSGYTSNQSFGGSEQGYSAMTTFLKTLSDTGLLVIISSIGDNSALDTYSGKTDLTTQIKNLGGTDDSDWIGAAGASPYSLIGTPGLGKRNGFEMYGPNQRDSSSLTIQGILTKDKFGNFQFIYPNFTPFETKSWANSDGSYSGSIKVGDQEIQASIPGGHFPAGQGGFQVAYIMRENLDWETVPMEYELNPMVYQTNVPGQESQAITKLISDLKTAAFWKTHSWPRPDCLMVIIQSIGVPFGATSLYDPQAMKDLEKVINNLGGTEATFHAVFKNPGSAAGPNKYSLLGIAVNGMDPMPTKPRLGPTESLEASTLRLQEDGTWTVFKTDGNVRGLLNKNNQGMYVSFYASEGVPNVDLSLPLILFQDPTPWIAGDAGKDPTPYMAAYSWISTYITGASPQSPDGTCSTPGEAILKGGRCGDLRTYYPTMDNDWSPIWTILYSNDGDMDIQVNKFCQSATGQGTDFNCDQYRWMKNQLLTEMNYVKAAKSLFHDDILQFLTDLTLTESSTLNSFYTAAYTTLGIDPTTTNTTQNILNMVDAVARQAQIMGCMSAKPAVVVVASIVNLGLGIASRFIPDSQANPVAGDVSATIQDLWQEISDNYLKETFVARKSYELVTSDWGKLQEAEKLFNKWDENSRDLALTTMIVGFEAYFYKVLIPTAYTKLERIPGTQYASPGDVEICDHAPIGGKCVVISTHAPDVPAPDYVALASQAWDPFLAREAKDLYWVYKGDHYKREFIPGDTLNNLFAPFDYSDTDKIGVSRVDFFTRWPFGADYYDCRYYDCNSTGTLCYTCVDGKIDWCF